MKVLLIVALVSLSIGCASIKTGSSQSARVFFSDLLGKSKLEILGCLGSPERSKLVDDFEFMTYRSNFKSDTNHEADANSSSHVEFMVYRSNVEDDASHMVDVKISTPNATAISSETYCDVTFIIKGDIVEKIKSSGRMKNSEFMTSEGISLDFDRCLFVIQNCGTN